MHWNKKGVSLIVGMVILISISLTLASMIYFWVSGTITKLSPPVYCSEVSFETEIVKSNGDYFLNAINLGDIEIKGFVIKSVGGSEILKVGEVDLEVKQGMTESRRLDFVGSSGKYLIIPKVRVSEEDQETIRECDDNVGLETTSREVIAE